MLSRAFYCRNDGEMNAQRIVFILPRAGRIFGAVLGMVLAAALPAMAQDDVTTQHASSALDGAWITGPASNPLSHLNGPAFRTTGSPARYDIPDFAPASDLDARLPRWIAVQAEERFRYEGSDNNSFKAGSDDAYLLNRFRLETDLRAGSWLRVSAQVQDARPFLEDAPIGPPNENRWDLKLAYAELGDPEKHWFSLRVGRQIINYNNTIIADSEWRNQGRSFDAAVLNLQSSRAHLGMFAASALVPQALGVSPHQEGNNIYGAYGRVDGVLGHSALEPFVLWRVQPAEAIQPALSKATGKEDEKAYGVRWKGWMDAALDYSAEVVVEKGRVGAEAIRAWAATGGAAYQFRNSAARSRIFAQYDFASGSGAPGDGVHRTFDTMYPTAHDRFGIVDQFGWQNIEAVRAGGTAELHRRWTVSAQGLDFWAASALDAVYNTSGSAIAVNKTDNGRHIGAEGDVYTWYELNRHFNLGAGHGWFGGGSFLAHVVTSHTYEYSYIVLNFKDNGRGAGE